MCVCVCVCVRACVFVCVCGVEQCIARYTVRKKVLAGPGKKKKKACGFSFSKCLLFFGKATSYSSQV